MKNNSEKCNITLNLQAQIFIDSGLTVSELFTIAGLYHSDFEDFVTVSNFESLQEKGYVLVSKFTTSLTLKGQRFIKEISEKQRSFRQKIKPIISENLATDEFVEKYRAMFKGKKPGAMGFSKNVKSKLLRFFMENPNVTQEQVLSATRRYMDELRSYDYLQQADYFIYKREPGTNYESSKLTAFIEETSSTTNSSLSDDWATKLI